MLNLSMLENIHADIQCVYEVVTTMKANIDGKEIEIKLLRSGSDHYFFELSHYYKGADNYDPYISVENRFSSIEEAARGALQSATMFYRSSDQDGTWVKSEHFLQ